MLLLLLPIHSPVAIRLTFKEKGDFDILGQKKLALLELSSFLYDISLLYNCVALSVISDYDNYYFSRYFWYHKERPLRPEHRLYLNKINQNSPLELEVVIPLAATAAGIFWLIIQAIEKIQKWELNREKLKLEVEKLRLEVEQKNVERFKQDIELDNILEKQGAKKTFYRIVKRIEKRQLIAIDVEIKILESNKKENN